MAPVCVEAIVLTSGFDLSLPPTARPSRAVIQLSSSGRLKLRSVHSASGEFI